MIAWALIALGLIFVAVYVWSLVFLASKIVEWLRS